MLNIGVIGLGMMGTTHLGVYKEHEEVRITAVSDKDHQRLHSKSSIDVNIEGLPEVNTLSMEVSRYENADELIEDANVQVVDICLPTNMHLKYTKSALAAGKHVIVEKPLGRTSAEAFEMADTADRSPGYAMPAMCMRFWPGWDWLKQTISRATYGRVLSAHFRRFTSHPGGRFYFDGNASGGALLDLHVHDADFIQYCFGMPRAVFSRGYSAISGEIDNVTTQYIFDNIPIVTAEGSWAVADGFGLEMRYTVNFERATTSFEFTDTNHLTLFEPGKKPKTINISSGMGYSSEIVYFLECISNNRAPDKVTFRDAANSIVIVEAERQSIASKKIVALEKKI